MRQDLRPHRFRDQTMQRVDTDTIETVLDNIGIKGFKEP